MGAKDVAVEEKKAEEDAPVSQRAKKNAVLMLIVGIFQAVLQHVLALQSDVALFSKALGGNEAAVARCLASATGITGVAGLFLNQIGGKLSDALGRRLFFLSGPAVNILSGLVVVKRSGNIATLMAMRIVRSVFITFSGTVMCQAALADICSGQELAVVGTRIQAAVGVAVVAGPYLESLILKITKGDHRGPFKAMAFFSLVQLVTNFLFMPETLAKQKRIAMAEFFSSVASINPFSFVKAYMGKNAVLKKLLTIQTLQFCVDGKVTSDLFQMWSKNNLRWTSNVIRDFVAFWGLAVTFGGAFLHPFLLKKLSLFNYTTVGNLSVWAGLSLHGLMEKGACMWGGVPFLVPGVNGGSAHAVKSLSLDIAQQEGYGNGEFSAWANNMRALAQSIDTVFLGIWYARCKDRGIYPGTAWFLAGFIGAGLPQLMLMAMNKSDLAPPSQAKA